MPNFTKIFFLLIFSTSVFAQGVCDKTGVEKGGFTFDGPAAVCKGQEIKIKDNSGGTDIKYIYGYQGEDASKLAGINSTTDLKYTFLAAGQYVILQYGKKNGKEMYFCNVAVVRESNEPKFSYNSCNNSMIEIVIPINTTTNNFDSYKINWGDANPDETVLANQLPYKKTKNLTTPRTIKVEGIYNTASGCAAPNAKVIPLFTPNAVGYQLPNHININKVELTSGTEAKLTIQGSYDTNGFQLFMTPKGSAYPTTAFQNNVTPGTFKVSIPDTTKSYCFYLIRYSPCVEQSAEICTNPIIDYKVLAKQNQLAWLNYPSQMTGIPNQPAFGRYLVSQTSILKQETGKSQIIIPSTGTPSITDPVDCTKEVCYQIKTVTSGQLYYWGFAGESLSQKICIDRQNIHPPAISQAVVSVNAQNQAVTTFTDNSGWSLKKDKYRLYRFESNAFKEVESATTVTNLIDKIDASEKSYCYKLDYVDECGSNSELSLEFCTTYLSETTTGLIQWTSQSPFGNSTIKAFEIQSFDENTGVASTEATQTTTQTTFEPKLDKFEEEAKYRIKVVSADGKESLSNVYTIPVKVKMFIPDAFSPNEDGINDDLTLKGSFKRFTEFQLEIYNRWGIPVFTSNDVTNSWDGKYLNNIAPTDTYTFKINAKLKDGSEFNKFGKFLLLR